jgi:hypothetical protein
VKNSYYFLKIFMINIFYKKSPVHILTAVICNMNIFRLVKAMIY